MPFYLGALRMLNIATGYSKNTLSCSELNEEPAGEGFRSLRHTLTPLWACKAKKCHFSRKFDLWPDLTRSNINLGPKTICAIARSRRGASTGLFREALRPSGADRQGGGSYQPPPPLTVRVMRNALTGRGLNNYIPLGISSTFLPRSWDRRVYQLTVSRRVRSVLAHAFCSWPEWWLCWWQSFNVHCSSYRYRWKWTIGWLRRRVPAYRYNKLRLRRPLVWTIQLMLPD